MSLRLKREKPELERRLLVDRLSTTADDVDRGTKEDAEEYDEAEVDLAIAAAFDDGEGARRKPHRPRTPVDVPPSVPVILAICIGPSGASLCCVGCGAGAAGTSWVSSFEAAGEDEAWTIATLMLGVLSSA